MNIFINLIIILLISTNVFSREIGQTEITTEEGIEVYQDSKYYLLKKNVQIKSDEFNLKGDLVKIFFDKSLYDIKLSKGKNYKLINDLSLSHKTKILYP